MKKVHKLGLVSFAIALGAIVLSGCTANFCSVKEKSRLLFAIEPGVSRYYDSEAEANAAKNEEKYTYPVVTKVEGTDVWQLVEQDGGKYTKSNQLGSVIEAAQKANLVVPGANYFAHLDRVVLGEAVAYAKTIETTNVSEGYFDHLDKVKVERILTDYGYLKYFGTETKKDKDVDALWTIFDRMNKEIALEDGIEHVANADFIKIYKSTLETAINNSRACITSVDGNYGAYGQDKISIKVDAKNWGYAWSRGGAVIEGLIVYPVSCLVDAIAYGFAGHNPANFSNGVPQILALLFATIIVRLFIFLVSFKSTMTQQRMTQLQPELAKIQAKYPNSNTNPAQKQRLAQEQMALYRKHKVNPLSSLLVLVIQFPIFIGVWGAMTGNAVLSTGSFLGLNLSTSVWDALTKVNPVWSGGWWTALVLFLLMAVAQFMAMKVPQWIQKAKAKKVARLGKNPAQQQQNRTMNIVSWVMLIMIIFMGFTLPAAMGFYWFVGALVSLAQSLITNAIFSRKRK